MYRIAYKKLFLKGKLESTEEEKLSQPRVNQSKDKTWKKLSLININSQYSVRRILWQVNGLT
jgi:hypothetical protein